MTSTIETIGLSFAGFDLQDVETIHLSLTADSLFGAATVRGVDVTVPGADGQTARPRRFHERHLVLEGFVRGAGGTTLERQSNYRSNLDALIALFDETAEPDDLVALTEDGNQRTIAARTLNRMLGEPVKSEWAQVSIELLAIADWTVEPASS